jgi:hypothetical protein
MALKILKKKRKKTVIRERVSPLSALTRTPSEKNGTIVCKSLKKCIIKEDLYS